MEAGTDGEQRLCCSPLCSAVITERDVAFSTLKMPFDGNREVNTCCTVIWPWFVPSAWWGDVFYTLVHQMSCAFGSHDCSISFASKLHEGWQWQEELPAQLSIHFQALLLCVRLEPTLSSALYSIPRSGTVIWNHQHLTEAIQCSIWSFSS